MVRQKSHPRGREWRGYFACKEEPYQGSVLVETNEEEVARDKDG